MRAKAPARRKPAVKRRPKAALRAAVPAPPLLPEAETERFSLWRLALVLGLTASLAFPLKQILKEKFSQHLLLHRVVPVLKQGDEPGHLSAILGLKGTQDGGIISLSRSAAGFRVQRFNASLTPTAWVDLPASRAGELVDLAPLTGDGILLAASSGALLKLDAGLKPQGAPYASGLNNIGGLAGEGGVVIALNAQEGSIGRIDPSGKPLGVTPLKAALGARGIAGLKGGAYALLVQRQDNAGAVIVDAQDRVLRSFSFQGVAPASPVRLGAMGDVLAVNDAVGAQGIVFYHSNGKPLGNTMGVDHDPVAFPGFVAGDPNGAYAYIHFGAGLLKVALPWQEQQ